MDFAKGSTRGLDFIQKNHGRVGFVVFHSGFASLEFGVVVTRWSGKLAHVTSVLAGNIGVRRECAALQVKTQLGSDSRTRYIPDRVHLSY